MSQGLVHALRSRILGELAGIETPALPKPPQPAIEIDPHRFVGRYETPNLAHLISRTADGGLEMRMEPRARRTPGLGWVISAHSPCGRRRVGLIRP
jgi:hypothetical protein